MCTHLLPVSFLLFIFWLLFMFCIMNCFSETQRSHARLPGSYVLQVFRIFHSILGFEPRPSSQIYCESVVEFLLVSSRNEWVWLLYLVLKGPSVIPM